MKALRPATSSAALAGVLAACLLFAAPAASAPPRPITGLLDRPGLTVVALSAQGDVTRAPARPRFRLVPPAPKVTLHLLDRTGAYAGPVVARGRGREVVTGVRAGARLGEVEVHERYARVARRLPRRALDSSATARARRGVPLGADSLGLVRGRARGPRAPGADPDRDGIPSRFDVDDDGDLVVDVRERDRRRGGGEGRRESAGIPLGACPVAVCSGSVDVDLSSADKADLALALAIAAAVLAAASLLWQLLGSRRWRMRRVEVDVRLGLPIYQEGGGDWSVFVEVVNRTDHPVRWVSAALELADGRRLYLMQQPRGGELPVVLQPHESHQTWTPCADLERLGLDLTEPVVGMVKLDTGALLRSPRRRLLSRSAAKRWRG